MELVIRQARLRGQLCDIGIEDGHICAIEPWLEGQRVVEAEGGLVLPAFVNGHLHACKSFWRVELQRLRLDPDWSKPNSRFALLAEVKRHYTVERVAERAERALRLAVRHGTGALRLFADVDGDAGLRALEGLLQLKKRYRNTLQIQVMAFPQNGVFREGFATEALLREALQMGVDGLGGIPWLEPTEEARQSHIELVLELAQTHRLPAHFVLDDTDDPTSRTAEYVAARTVARGLQGWVHGTQANALAFYDDAHAERVVGLVKQAGMTIFANAHIALVTIPARHQPAPRGMTRVRELLAVGVPVAVAQDDIDNPYYPFGRNDLLEAAHYMAHLAPLAWGNELEQVLEMITHTPARALGLQGYGLEVGCRADLVVLQASDWWEALSFQAEKTWVVLGGRVVAHNRREEGLWL